MRQLERASGTAQALLSAVTLSGALAGPLLAIGLEPDTFGYLLAGLVGVYLVLLAVAVRACLGVIYTRQGDDPAAVSVLHYRHIAAHDSAEVYAQRVLGMSDHEQITGLLSDCFVVSQVVTAKAARAASAVRWTGMTLGVLALLVLVKAMSLLGL